VFAAARSGTAVLVRDPALPAPRLGALPPGTWLVATTSGTSGRPRAICRTARSWALSVRPLAEIAGLGPGDRVALTGPLHATLHLFAAVHTLCIGAHLTDDLQDATAVHCVPAVLADVVGFGARSGSAGPGARSGAVGPDARSGSVGPLRTVVVAGSALPDAVARRAAAQGISVIEYYGAAELSFAAIRRWPEPALRPFPGAELRVGDDGRLWVRSPYRALGYAETAQGPVPGSAGPLEIDTEGYATVGDLARTADIPGAANPEHEARPAGAADPGAAESADTPDPRDAAASAVGVVILGRGDAAITVGGATVLAEDVEAALAAIPGVAAAAVVGLPHPRLGEIVAAALEIDGTATPASIRAAARTVLFGPSLPRRYAVAERLPRTASGKISRAAARRLLAPEG
jgi:acyl-CoA synthetase (AMP-forming)/AMP-acid ligase II